MSYVKTVLDKIETYQQIIEIQNDWRLICNDNNESTIKNYFNKRKHILTSFGYVKSIFGLILFL